MNRSDVIRNVYSPFSTVRCSQLLPDSQTVHAHYSKKEWEDDEFNGITAAAKFATYVAEGKHKKSYTYEPKKRERPVSPPRTRREH